MAGKQIKECRGPLIEFSIVSLEIVGNDVAAHQQRHLDAAPTGISRDTRFPRRQIRAQTASKPRVEPKRMRPVVAAEDAGIEADACGRVVIN